MSRRQRLPGERVLQLPTKGNERPKGLAPYKPNAGSKNARILTTAQEVVERYRRQGRLPLGSREVGYVLTGEGYTKADIDLVEDVLVRARQDGCYGIDWDDISDGRTAVSRPWVPDSPEDAADTVLAELNTAQLDRQRGQRYRVEVWAEAASWIARLDQRCKVRGVAVHSGSGSVPIEGVRRAAIRAYNAFVELQQCTVILSLGDLDPHGLRNIARPFEAGVHAFVRDFLAAANVGDDCMPVAQHIVAVRRLLITADQAEAHVPKSARDKPAAKETENGWPYGFKVQAEALLPEIRDQLVEDAIDELQDAETLQSVIDEEDDLRSTARAVLVERLAR